MYGRGVAVSKSDIATYSYALLALKASGAPLGGAVELHFTYDEEVGGAIGPAWILEQRPVAAGFRVFRRVRVRHHHGAQRLPAPRSRNHRPVRARGTSRDGHRRARGRDRRAGRALRDPSRLRGDEIEGRRNRRADAHRGPDCGGHQYQRRAGQGHVSDRPAHHPRGEPGRSRSHARRGRSAMRPPNGPASRATSGGSCWPFRSCRFPVRKSWSRPSPAMRRPSWART